MIKKNPYVVTATVKNINYDVYNMLYEIQAVDDNANERSFYVSKRHMPENYAEIKNVTLWCGKGGGVAYVAFGDCVANTLYSGNAKIDQFTARHLADYERKARARWATKKRLVEIQQQIATIGLVDSKSASDIEQAKKTVLDFLNAQAESICQSLSRHR